MKLSQGQLLILAILAVVLVILIVVGIWVVYENVRQQDFPNEDISTVAITPTSPSTAAPNITPTSTTRLPASPTIVSTFAPTSTPVVIASLTPIVKTPGNTAAPHITSTSIPEDSVCAINLAEELEVYEANIAAIDEKYLPQIAEIQSLLDQAIGDGETLTIRRLTRDLEALQVEYEDAVKEENERYEREKVFIELRYCT